MCKPRVLLLEMNTSDNFVIETLLEIPPFKHKEYQLANTNLSETRYLKVHYKIAEYLSLKVRML